MMMYQGMDVHYMRCTKQSGINYVLGFDVLQPFVAIITLFNGNPKHLHFNPDSNVITLYPFAEQAIVAIFLYKGKTIALEPSEFRLQTCLRVKCISSNTLRITAW